MILGIDTSNYTTSVAIVDRDFNIVCDNRKLLDVKKGNKGLRQSEALFQHIENLPKLLDMINFKGISIDAVAVSSRPRPVEGSYMPCFKAGMTVGRSIADALSVPYMEFSHQEGHIAAIKKGSEFENEDNLICCHLSGGTCEILEVRGKSISIAGGSRDLSFGQIIDRAGVYFGLDFPAGKDLDKMALAGTADKAMFRKVKVEDGYFNISGLENQVYQKDAKTIDICASLFERITQTLADSVMQVSLKTGIEKVVFAGGVSSSEYIRSSLPHYLNTLYIFGKPELSSDNAVGTAILGGMRLWQPKL